VQIASKTISRTFQLDLDGLGGAAREVLEVFAALESDTLGVYSPYDPDALLDEPDDEGDIRLRSRATQPAKISDWVACACQQIRFAQEWDTSTDRKFRTEHTHAWYSNNLARTLIVWDGLSPPVGPCGVTGEIVLTEPIMGLFAARHLDAFRFTVAHELTHVFDALAWVVPAFQDWEAFCTNINPLGRGADQIVIDDVLHSETLDDYGGEKELWMIERYWPGHAKRWFDAYNAHLR